MIWISLKLYEAGEGYLKWDCLSKKAYKHLTTEENVQVGVIKMIFLMYKLFKGYILLVILFMYITSICMLCLNEDHRFACPYIWKKSTISMGRTYFFTWLLRYSIRLCNMLYGYQPNAQDILTKCKAWLQRKRFLGRLGNNKCFCQI